MNGNGVSSTTDYLETNEWVFFGVSYDGSRTSNNVVFYKGTRSSEVTVGAVASLSAGKFPSRTMLAIGNNYSYSTPTQPFDGWLDNLRMHVGNGSDGILTAGELEALRVADVTGDSPPVRVRVVLGLDRSDGEPRLNLSAWTLPGYRHELQSSVSFADGSEVTGGSFDGDGSLRTWEVSITNPGAFYRLLSTPLPLGGQAAGFAMTHIPALGSERGGPRTPRRAGIVDGKATLKPRIGTWLGLTPQIAFQSRMF